MPIVHIYSFDRPIEVKHRVVKGITELLCREYNVKPENITVNIIAMDKDHVAHGGMLVPDREAAGLMSSPTPGGNAP